MRQRPRVLLMIPHLGGGGAERVIAELASRLERARFEVHVCVATTQGRTCELLPADIAVHRIGVSRVRYAALPLVSLIWRLRPDLILPGMVHLSFLVLLLRPFFPRRTRVLVRQNGPVLEENHSRKARVCYRLLYPRAEGIICQTAAMAENLALIAGARGKIRVLRNPVNVEEIRSLTRRSRTHWTGPGPHLLAVGRLSQEKGYDLLLRAFSALRERYGGVDLTILGDGAEKAYLARLASRLGIESAVRFAGHVRDPAEWFNGASLFASSSRWEGMPNSLLEAASAGLPIAATPARGGMAELLADKAGIWLAPAVSVEGLLQALQTALDRLLPGQRFAHAWIEEFRSSNAVLAYEEWIEEILAAAP